MNRFKWQKRKIKLREKKRTIILATAVIAVALIVVYFLFSGAVEPFAIITGLSTIGYKQVSVDAAVIGDQGIVLLTSDCYQITANVEAYQAESIIMGLENISPARPNAHDIAADAFNSLDVQLLMVKITDMRNNTFYGKMILKNGNRIAELDARPSDATAIAIRMGVPIYVNEELLKENGEYIC
jgi:bifunctional DNase/RNase